MSVLKRLGINLPPLPSTPPTHDPQRITLIQLAIIIGFAVIMHFQIADPVIAGFAVAVYALKLGLIVQNKAAPGRVAMMILTIVSLVLIIMFYGGWNGQRAGISFLVLLVSLKFLESRGLRDYFVVCLILYFLAASSFLFDSSLLSIAVVLFYTLAITNILFQLANPSALGWIQPLKASASLVVKALPLTVLLFFFFPRIQGDFGFLPSQDRLQNDSELSNSLVAGELAVSAFNEALAFRVEFDGPVPQPQDLYWRVKVMTAERNFQWEVVQPTTQDLQASKDLQAEMGFAQDQIRYQILHEPTRDLFIPYLDYVAATERGRVLYDYSVFQDRSNNSAFRYRGASRLVPITVAESQLNMSRLLQTQSQASARMQALLVRWRESAKTPAERVDIVYQYFLNNPFSYSLMPPSLGDDTPLEDFLFDSRVGYCEHYASAFTTLMRWLDVPARVVVGYQGGRSVNNGKFYELRYSDAHAWSEVWVDGRWQRVDPTAAISPERIEFGMDALMELWNSNSLGNNAAGQALADFLNPTGSARILRMLRDTWSDMGYQWNKWVVDYDFDTQKELLTKLGLENRNSVYALVSIMLAGGGALLVFYFWQLIPRRERRSEAQSAYLKFVRRFKKHDLNKQVYESPGEFADKAERRFPHLKEKIRAITRQYESIRYGREKPDPDQQLRAFKKLIKQFKITTP